MMINIIVVTMIVIMMMVMMLMMVMMIVVMIGMMIVVSMRVSMTVCVRLCVMCRRRRLMQSIHQRRCKRSITRTMNKTISLMNIVVPIQCCLYVPVQ